MTKIVTIIEEQMPLLEGIHKLVAEFAQKAEKRQNGELAALKDKILKNIDAVLAKVATISERVTSIIRENGLLETEGIGMQAAQLANSAQQKLTDILQTFKIRVSNIASDLQKGIIPHMQIEELVRLSVMSDRLLESKIESYLLKELYQADHKLSVGSRTMRAVNA